MGITTSEEKALNAETVKFIDDAITSLKKSVESNPLNKDFYEAIITSMETLKKTSFPQYNYEEIIKPWLFLKNK